MLNTGLGTSEILGLLNSDINLENKTLKVRDGVKRIKKEMVLKHKKVLP